METGVTIAEIAALMGDPGRANMLATLMDGRALTAKELASVAGVAPSTASGHLAKLAEGGLLSVVAQGRHRYFRLATADVAAMLESIMAVAQIDELQRRATPRISARLREARSCYDHLAGRVAVCLADALVAEGSIVLSDGVGAVTDSGLERLQRFGLTFESRAKRSQTLCRSCLDWSERRPHLAGRVGAALFERFLHLHWVERDHIGRAVTITAEGRNGLGSTFGLTFKEPPLPNSSFRPNRSAAIHRAP